MSDIHLDTTYPNSRIEGDWSFRTYDNLKKLEFVINKYQKVDYVFISGDVFNKPNVDDRLKDKFVKILSPIVKNCFVFVVSGQHDILSNKSSSFTAVKSVIKNWESNKNVFMVDFDYSYFKDDRTGIWCVPYGINIEKYLRLAESDRKAVRKDIDFSILVTHTPFKGVKLPNGHIMKDGVNPDLVKNFDYVAAGDIHTKNILNNIYYPGGLIRLNYGEAKSKKGFFVGFINNGKCKVKFKSLKDRKYIVVQINSDKDLEKIFKSPDRYKNSIIKVVSNVSNVDVEKVKLAIERIEKEYDAKYVSIKYVKDVVSIERDKSVGFSSINAALTAIVKKSGLDSKRRKEIVRYIRKVKKKCSH